MGRELKPRSAKRALPRIPLTAVDEGILHLDSPDEPWSVHLEARVGGALDVARLRDALAAALARHPRARARRATCRDRWTSYQWEVPARPDVDALDVVECADDDALSAARSDLQRVFLRQHRDPAQALEELNPVLSTKGGPEEFVSLCAVVFDTAAATLRFASAGHPPAWFWHDGEVRALGATGPLLTVDESAGYTSREIELRPGDLLLRYTDGLAEARSGAQLFGDERIAQIVRRDPGEDADVLCKTLLEAARDFAASPLHDVAILAIRRT